MSVVSIDESLETVQNSGAFIAKRKVEEFLHLMFTIHSQKLKDECCFTRGVL